MVNGCSVRSTAGDDGRNGLRKQLEIQAEGPFLDLLEVHIDPGFEVDVGSPADLPDASEPRLDQEAPTLALRVVQELLRRADRGPTKLMLPISTLRNCGNSSIESRRIAAPTGVILGSPRILKMGTWWMFYSACSYRRAWASRYIDRNLSMRNDSPPRPTRSCT